MDYTRYSGTAGTQGTAAVTGLTDYRWYEFVCYDISPSSFRSDPSLPKRVFVTGATRPQDDRLIAVRDRISANVSEFQFVKISPELAMVQDAKAPYCTLTSGGIPRQYENSAWGQHTVRVAVFGEIQQDMWNGSTLIGIGSDKGINALCDEISELFDGYIPTSNSPFYHVDAVRVGNAQKVESPDQWLRMIVIDITLSYQRT